jgi:hypothetical protein
MERIDDLARDLRLALGTVGMLANYRRKLLRLFEIRSCAFGYKTIHIQHLAYGAPWI